MGLSLHASWVVLAIGFVVPFITTLAVKQHNRYLQSFFSFAAVTLLGVGAKLTNVVDVNIGELISIIGSAGIVAGGSTKWLTGDAVGRVSRATKRFGLGRDKSITANSTVVNDTVLPQLEPLQPVDPAHVTAAVSKPPPS